MFHDPMLQAWLASVCLTPYVYPLYPFFSLHYVVLPTHYNNTLQQCTLQRIMLCYQHISSYIQALIVNQHGNQLAVGTVLCRRQKTQQMSA